jgi:hypothetical protein
VAELRTCIVTYRSQDSIQHSVQVVAATVYEAAVLGLKALKVPPGIVYNLSIDIRVKSPEAIHTISGAVLNAWLAREGKNPKEQALKDRLHDLLREEKNSSGR